MARRVSSRRVYQGKVLSLDVDEVEEPGGVRATREVVRHHGSVAVLAARADGRFLLVRQYRYPADDALWELPAGRIDPGEAPEAAAQRELREEVGFRAGKVEKIAFFFTTPGFCDEAMHVYRGSSLVESRADADDDERIEIGAFTADELRAMVQGGEIREGKTLVAVLMELSGLRHFPSAERGL